MTAPQLLTKAACRRLMTGKWLPALVALVVVSPAVGVERDATMQERWVIDRAAGVLRLDGMDVPPYRVVVNDNTVGCALAAEPGLVTICGDVVAGQMARATRIARRPKRVRAWLRELEAEVVDQAYYWAVHEVVHLVQPVADRWEQRPWMEGVADAIAVDTVPRMIRYRFGGEAASSLAFVLGYPRLQRIAWRSTAGRDGRRLRVLWASRLVELPGGWNGDGQ